MSKSVYYCRFTGDYARDTSHLTLIQHGAYTVLLDFYYSTGKPLPPDMNALCRICRAFEDAERDAVSQIVSAFFELKPGGYHNKRADAELAYRAEQHERLSEAGKKGAKGKWGKDGQAIGLADGKTHGIPSPSPNPTPTPQKSKAKPAAKSTRPADSRHQPFFFHAFEAFRAKHQRAPIWTAKDRKGLKSLLADQPAASLPLERLQALWRNYLESTEPYTVKQGSGLAYFCSNLDKFSDGPILARKGKANGINEAVETTMRGFAANSGITH